jgi:S-adenosylmethionine hydrolase
MARVVTFLTDYGYEDEFVGVCHGVIARVAPEVRVIDVTHGIARHDVRSGALILRGALPYFPAGVHLAVVDPASAASGARSRCAPARRTGSWSARTTACCHSPPPASGARWRRST